MIPAGRLLLVFIGLTVASGAGAADRWEEAGSGAVAILPAPLKATVITGGSLHCSEQRWSLRLRTEGEIAPIAEGKTGIDIDGTAFDSVADIARDHASLRVPYEALELLRDGSRLNVRLTGDPKKPDAVFALRGSRAVLDAIVPRCSQVDMSAYTAVSLTPDHPAVEPAKKLLDEWAKGYRAWSGKQPTYAATVLDVEPDKKLMFASICGSPTYFGASGCSLNGYASDSTGAEWRQVYETEGVLLHTDPKTSNGGWPNLATLPAVNGTEASHWIWNGAEYELRELLAAEQDEPAELRGTTAQ